MWSTHAPAIADGRNPLGNTPDPLVFLRRYARRLLRDVHGDDMTRAMPVLRRLIAQRVTPELQLRELLEIRASLQLKHVLHMLARELGFAAWEKCKQEIAHRPDSLLDGYRLELGMFNDHQLNWFADAATAQAWQREHGGYLVAYGTQMVAVLA
ncbi:hypothetical protein GCM10007205_24640 [Oxalicibacterium flavum]|uniref:Uncharacterized protein n=1 Tax=Oxalicibacterium flavum TaxID=179467 RepID=A0A8J2XYQ9_9BURK|nr:hypothetical protein [Oxalicibacterium flavum]GGC14816.1 hypothetical protein GCM10007205_24640 [Oxalicibacterium flavum]